MNKRRVVIASQKYFVNPLARVVAGFIGPALIETTGRKSGRPRRNPVGATFHDGAFWIVAEHGLHANYVRNIQANPHVRIKHRGRWHDGNALIVPDEDPHKHLHGVNGMTVRIMGTELLTIRIAV